MKFPRVNLPDVTEDERAEVQRLIEEDARAKEIMQRNRDGMRMAMVRKGISSLPTHSHKRRKRHA
jgi:hypothetical protein